MAWGVWEQWNLQNAPCEACPHPGVADSKESCQDQCQSLAGRGCTGFVYNSAQECYLKSGPLAWKREKESGLQRGWNITTWAGVPCLDRSIAKRRFTTLQIGRRLHQRKLRIALVSIQVCKGATFPPYIKFFLHTMQWSAALVDMLLFHEDSVVPVHSSQNVRFVNLRHGALWRSLAAIFATRDSKIETRRLASWMEKSVCAKRSLHAHSLKPLLGEALSEHLLDYSHWGYIDIVCIPPGPRRLVSAAPPTFPSCQHRMCRLLAQDTLVANLSQWVRSKCSERVRPVPAMMHPVKSRLGCVCRLCSAACHTCTL